MIKWPGNAKSQNAKRHLDCELFCYISNALFIDLFYINMDSEREDIYDNILDNITKLAKVIDNSIDLYRR